MTIKGISAYKHLSGRAGTRPKEDTILARWIVEHDMSRWEFAELLKRRYNTVCAWADGRALPGLINAILIEQATHGGVPMTSWLGTTLGRMEWEHAAVSDFKEERRSARLKQRAFRARRKDAPPEPTVIVMEPTNG